MRGRPPKKLTPDQLKAADAFASGAEAPSSGSGRSGTPGSAGNRSKHRARLQATPSVASRNQTDGALPWEADYVREDVVKGYALRLPEPLYLKLKWVAAEQGLSMNELILTSIADVVANHLAEQR